MAEDDLANNTAEEKAAIDKAAADKAAAIQAVTDKTALPDPNGNPILTVAGDYSPGDKVQFVSGSDVQAVTELSLAPVQKAGYNLAVYILLIISGFLVFLVILLFTKTFDVSDKISLTGTNMSDTAFVHQKDLIKSLQEEKKNYRDFIISLSQMILLNLLLPTLTAILGYIFGSREGSATQRRNDAASGNT